jgi:hypothetical protein
LYCSKQEEAVSKGQFFVIASEAKQSIILVINGLLRANRPRNDVFITFEVALKLLTKIKPMIEDLEKNNYGLLEIIAKA